MGPLLCGGRPGAGLGAGALVRTLPRTLSPRRITSRLRHRGARDQRPAGHYAFFPDPEDRGENSSQVVHLGASARYRNFDNDTFNSEVQYRQRPFFHFTNTRSVDTGTVDDAEGDVWVGPAGGEDLAGGER